MLVYETDGLPAEIWGFISSKAIPGADSRLTPTLYSTLTGKDAETGLTMLPGAESSLPNAITSILAPIIEPLKKSLPYVAIGGVSILGIYLIWKFTKKGKVRK